MMSLRVELVFAWGYSVKSKKVSKAQHAHVLPPPTTLIGALSKGLAKTLGRGEIIESQGKLASPAKDYASMFEAASAYVEFVKDDATGFGKYWEDPLRYQILQFQKPHRRADPTYRFGLVPAGKVYCPSAKMVLGYLVNEVIAGKILGAEWYRQLINAAYSITHIGSKESITAVEKVELKGTEPIKSGELETRFYLPAFAVAEVIDVEQGPYGLGGTYIESFWKIGYEWGVEQQSIDYIVPGSRDPVISCKMKVKPAPNVESYMVGEDGLTVFA
jgi:CRISPR-associated protein Cas5a/b/c